MRQTPFLIALALFALSLMPAMADFSHTEYTRNTVAYDGLGATSCWKKEIDTLRTAAADTLQSNQDLHLGAAQAYDRLAELGQTC